MKIFEDFGFQSYCRRPAAWFSAYHYSLGRSNSKTTSSTSSSSRSSVGKGADECEEDEFPTCSVVVDSGFSFSHVVPFVNLRAVKPAIRKLCIGGKLLTNYLKEVVSFRQWNMMDEFKLMDQVKEETCYVSQDILSELALSREREKERIKNRCHSSENTLRKLFVLPDFHNVMRGFVKGDGEEVLDSEQVLTMETERFSVPEVLFHPSDIGMDQAGLPEAVEQSLHELNEVEQAVLTRSGILLTGGNAATPGFKKRMEAELRPRLLASCDLKVVSPQNPQNYAWVGASKFASCEAANDSFITKTDYFEYGHDYCNERFDSSW